jgi:hypothetical protein
MDSKFKGKGESGQSHAVNWSGVAPSTTAFDGRTASKCSETSKIDPKKQY